MAFDVHVAGTGAYLPGPPIPFDEIDTCLGELTDSSKRIRRWLENTRSVMKELLAVEYVYYAFDPKTREFFDDNITMSTKASLRALDHAGIAPGDIDLICYGSAHQDQMPTASVQIQEALGIERCDEFSVHANCTSAYKALYLAYELLRNGKNKTALVVSSNVSSSELRAEYYNQALVDKESLFLRWFLCDGAGAVVLTRDETVVRRLRVETTYVESIGGKRPSLMYNYRPAFWMNPREEFDKGLHHLRQNFRNELSTGLFFENGDSVFVAGFLRMLKEVEIAPASIDLFQVNLPSRHIAESVMDECVGLGMKTDNFYTKMDTLGYCGPPMVFICLDAMVREGAVGRGARAASFVTEVSKFMQAGYVMINEDS